MVMKYSNEVSTECPLISGIIVFCPSIQRGKRFAV